MNRPFRIWIEDKETLNKVLAKMEKEGIEWVSGRKPLYNVDIYTPPIGLFVDTTNILTYNEDVVYYNNQHNSKHYNEITPEEYLKESKEMTKADLKDWMIVKTRGGNRYFVDSTHNILVSGSGWMSLDKYRDDLLCNSDNFFDIVAVYEVAPSFAVRFYMNDAFNESEYLQTIWEREEPVEMTVAEIEEKLGIKNLKIIKEK